MYYCNKQSQVKPPILNPSNVLFILEQSARCQIIILPASISSYTVVIISSLHYYNSQEEESDESEVQVSPPGFHVMFLPFAEDVRKLQLPELEEDDRGEVYLV